jgi:hypothetical protein
MHFLQAKSRNYCVGAYPLLFMLVGEMLLIQPFPQLRDLLLCLQS